MRSGERPDLKSLLNSTHRLETSAFRGYDPIELGNAQLRRFAEDTVSQGWWQLLWVPPSMPHYTLGLPFAELAGMTNG